jgi:nucleoid-associated protein YgaU
MRSFFQFLRDLFTSHYTVKAGDNLSEIAKRYPNLTWHDIYNANRDIIKDPDLIYPEQRLRIPRK